MAEFYIGYNPKAPPGIGKHVKRVVILLGVLVLLLAWVLASQQRGFAGSTYEYAEETTISGFLSDYPVPSIHYYQNVKLDQMPVLQTIPLVKFGKIGGQELAKLWKQNLGTWVSVKGHLIYYDGKALLEVNDPQSMQPAVRPAGIGEWSEISPANVQYEQTKFVGEIVDAKCYFGVMKPGFGKPHRSCAIRCISGGIPAVLKVRDKLDRVNYHLMIMKEGTAKDLAARIGETVEVNGFLQQSGDWSVLTINSEQDVVPLSWSEPDFSNNLTLCY